MFCARLCIWVRFLYFEAHACGRHQLKHITSHTALQCTTIQCGMWCTRCTRNAAVRTMHMQSNVHNASVLHCANVYTAHSTILLMHNSAHIAQCTHGNASQQCSVMDRAAADQSVKCWRERTKCYSCALKYIICETYCRGSYTILCTFHKAHLFHPPAWWPQKKYFPGQRRQSVCVWLCPGSWPSSQSSAKRAHTSCAQLEWGSHWIDCRSNGNLIPGPKYHSGWWRSIVFTLIYWWESTKRDLSSPTQFSSCGPQKGGRQIFRQNLSNIIFFLQKILFRKTTSSQLCE